MSKPYSHAVGSLTLGNESFHSFIWAQECYRIRNTFPLLKKWTYGKVESSLTTAVWVCLLIAYSPWTYPHKHIGRIRNPRIDVTISWYCWAVRPWPRPPLMLWHKRYVRVATNRNARKPRSFISFSRTPLIASSTQVVHTTAVHVLI